MLGCLALSLAFGAARAASAAPTPSPGDTKNCPDFATWNQAQIWYETYLPYYGDIAGLDRDDDGIACEGLPGEPATAAPPTTIGSGYLMLESTGSVFGFGDMVPLLPLVTRTVVSVAAAPNGGYWLLAADGTVISRGAPYYGSVVDKLVLPSGEIPTTIAGLPNGSGYWVFTDKGRAIGFGAAATYGDMVGTPLNGAIVASAPTASGKGYWMVGSDGGIFSFGDALFYGSTGGMRLNRPVVGIAPDPDGVGYWLVASDGGIFAFSAEFKGSTGNLVLNQPVIGALAYGDGYLMVAADGGIFSYSSKPFLGSLGDTPPSTPIVGVAVRR